MDSMLQINGRVVLNALISAIAKGPFSVFREDQRIVLTRHSTLGGTE